ncbi:MAG: (d)CMP kinase [Gemmatimonadales bacterium]
MPNDKMAIAIDGPAASGKSSTAKAVARALGFHHVDSGSLYRAATTARARAGGTSDTWTEQSVLDAVKIVSLSPTEHGFTPLLDGQAAEAEMRSEAVTGNVSLVAKMSGVRDWVNSIVRGAGEEYDVVVDGRDIGTVVFPKARLKVFLVADPAERARRRLLERLNREPSDAEIAEETEKIIQRDEADSKQSGRAEHSVLIDTTRLTQQQQIAHIVGLAEDILSGPRESNHQ